MRFNPKARLDTRRVSDRGRGGGGRAAGAVSRSPAARGRRRHRRCPHRRAVPGRHPVPGRRHRRVSRLPGGGLDTGRFSGEDTSATTNCQTGADANEDVDCARVAVENSLYDYWSETLPDQAGLTFQPERDVVTFSGGVATGCGNATSAVGPFYCPPDATIYLDTTFFHDVLERQLERTERCLRGAVRARPRVRPPHPEPRRRHGRGPHPAGPGERRRTPRAAGRLLRRHVGRARHLDRRRLGPGPDRGPDRARTSQQAVAAAKAVGDDRIQQRTSGRVDPEGWTHGSAEQRVRWFMTGYEQGSLEACDTFSASSL